MEIFSGELQTSQPYDKVWHLMKCIRFEHIPDAGLVIEEDFSVDRLSRLLHEEGRELFFKASRPAHVCFELERQGAYVHIKAKGSFGLAHPCVRCWEDVLIEHALALDLRIEKPDAIDLESVMLEELFLELPTYPACEDRDCGSSSLRAPRSSPEDTGLLPASQARGRNDGKPL